MKKLFIFLGSSGTGKTTIGNLIEERLGILEIISTTTRPMRVGEIDGVSYNFVTHEELQNLDLVEHTEYAGNEYGLTKEAIDKAFEKNDKAFAVIEKDGLGQIKEYFKDSKEIQIIVIYFEITLEVMEKRMTIRGDKRKDIERRLQNAIDNKELENHYLADYVIDSTGTIEEVYEEVKNIILR